MELKTPEQQAYELGQVARQLVRKALLSANNDPDAADFKEAFLPYLEQWFKDQCDLFGFNKFHNALKSL